MYVFSFGSSRCVRSIAAATISADDACFVRIRAPRSVIEAKARSSLNIHLGIESECRLHACGYGPLEPERRDRFARGTDVLEPRLDSGECADHAAKVRIRL